jgi:hypothetical protein
MIEYLSLNSIDVSFEGTEKVVNEASHTCVPSIEFVSSKRARQYVEEKVVIDGRGIKESVGESTSLLRDVVGDLEAAQFPSVLRLRRNLDRMVARVRGCPPATFEDLNSIPESMSLTFRGSPFLLVFSSYINENGIDAGTIIVYATKEDLVKLFNPSDGVFVVDGTFKIKPKPYDKLKGAQVLTMNTLEGIPNSRRLYRRLLALLPSKSEHCYCEFLKLMLIAAEEKYEIDITTINWRRGMLDFEYSMRSAFRRCTSDLLLITDYAEECCHMHYCSAVLKHVKKVGLGRMYELAESGLRRLIRQLFALAFLPCHLMKDVYAIVKNEECIPEMLANTAFSTFLSYYEHTWLNEDTRHPLESWSVFLRADDMKRTNNDLEGKHRQYLKDFGIHPNLWSFISTLQTLQEHQECEELQYLSGGIVPTVMKRSNIQKEKELAVLKAMFVETRQSVQDGYQYLMKVSYKMKKYDVKLIEDVDDDDEI